MSAVSGVRGFFSASHRHPKTGALHGHDYEVWAFWASGCFEDQKEALNAVLAGWDHSVMPDELHTAEAIGAALIKLLGLVKAEVNRPVIGHRVEVWP